MPLADRSLILDVHRAAPQKLVAVGQRGHILLSEDEGDSWTQVQAPTRAMLTGVSFANRNEGIAVGHNNVILHTTDRGNSWNLRPVEAEFEVIFLDVLMLNPTTAFAIGAYGEFWQSEDGGKSWEQNFITEDELHLNVIEQGKDGTLYIAGESGTLLRSDDRGQSWQALNSPYFGSFHGLLAVNTSQLLVFGLRGHVFYSRDRGDTWTDLTVDVPVLFSGGTVTTRGWIVLAGQGGNLLVSQDDGFNFRQVRRIELEKIVQVQALEDGAVLVAGNRGLTRISAEDLATYFQNARPLEIQPVP